MQITAVLVGAGWYGIKQCSAGDAGDGCITGAQCGDTTGRFAGNVP